MKLRRFIGVIDKLLDADNISDIIGTNNSEFS